KVAALFERNPFPQSPPRYVRATLYRYRFTTAQEHQQTGAWWKRQELGEYLPGVSLEDVHIKNDEVERVVGSALVRMAAKPHHFPRTVRSTSSSRFAQDRKRADSSGNEI